MDEFPGLLARDIGFRPPGKPAPMSTSKAAAAAAGGGGTNLGLGSGRSSAPAPSWKRSRSGWSAGDSRLGRGTSGDRSPPAYDDVFGGPPRYSNPTSHGRSVSSAPPPFDSILDGFKDSASKHSSVPVYDKPVYDDEIFVGVSGMNNPSTGKYDDVFNHDSFPSYDDLLESLGRTMPEPKGSVDKRSGQPKEQDLSGFDDRIPGFGGSSPPQQREPPEFKQQHAASSGKPTPEDPFVVLETTSTPAYPSLGLFNDPLEHITRPMNSGSSKNDACPVSGGLFEDDELTKSVPLFTSKINDTLKDKSPLKTEKEPPQRSSMETFENSMPKMQSTKSFDSLRTAGRSGVQNSDTSASRHERNAMADQSPESYEHLETADDAWLSVAEIPLFTQPTSVPPPSRPPPPITIKQAPFRKTDQFSSVGSNATRKDNNSSSQSSHIYQHMKNSVRKSGVSPIDELDFVLGKPERYANEVPSSEEEIETNSAAAAMKEAVDRAEAKFKHAREVRERERDAKSTKSRESTQQERDEKAIPDAQDPDEDEEKQDRLYHQREQREREEKEEQNRREKEREQEFERERGRGRQAVERATREARERAATEARLKAERAAVGKANAEARQRAERAAFQKAAAGARERAAAEAREKVEKVAAEAREREKAAAEAKERERAAVREREAKEKIASETSSTIRKSQSTTNIVDDLAFIFGAGEFQEVEGESEERRRARLERDQRTRERATKALAEKNERDMHAQREQAERHRIADTLDMEIKRWAAGKEGNLLALLSTLQYVLWPECGWQPVSLTDLITGASVKKVYRKATLCIHPDKVQQKGATLQQKYIAEKVFDLLKEAWNKYSEEPF